MLLSITLTRPPGAAYAATDLGYLLHKNPARVQEVELSFGKAHVFYPEAGPDRTTATLLLDIDPVELARGHRESGGGAYPYVNDRPYVVSSFMSVALSRVYGTALSGRSKERPELAAQALPLSARLAVVAGGSLIETLFAPLGYQIRVQTHPLDERFPDWGEGRYATVTLTGEHRLQDLLHHLYVLIPALDAEKHYWVGEAEVTKLLRHGEGWLAAHPARELIARRYLRQQGGLARLALAQLSEEEDAVDPDERREERDAAEQDVERPLALHQQRLGAVVAALRAAGARTVIDLGCGEGKLLRLLRDDRGFQRIAGMDVSPRALQIAAERLRLDRAPERDKSRITLFQGSLLYRDHRLSGYDAAAVVEVVEHLDIPRLAAFERVLFEFARPATVVLTTPNVEYNARFAGLPAGRLRHEDHRFEWTRAQFLAWTSGIGERFGYTARVLPVGPEDPEVGAPTQMAVFSLGQEVAPGPAAKTREEARYEDHAS